MTRAILELEGMGCLEGTAEIGGDYVRLLIDGRTGIADFETAARGQIRVDGRVSEVVLENATMQKGEDGGVVLTMRLFKPLA